MTTPPSKTKPPIAWDRTDEKMPVIKRSILALTSSGLVGRFRANQLHRLICEHRDRCLAAADSPPTHHEVAYLCRKLATEKPAWLGCDSSGSYWLRVTLG